MDLKLLQIMVGELLTCPLLMARAAAAACHAVLCTFLLAAPIELTAPIPREQPARRAEDGRRIDLFGRAQIDAQLRKLDKKVELSGTVTDDAGSPVPFAEVLLQLLLPSKPPQAPHLLATGLGEGCEGSSRWLTPTVQSDKLLMIKADGRGRFCIRYTPPAEQTLVRLEVPRRGWLEESRLELAANGSLHNVELRFEPPLSGLSLDSDTVDVSVRAVLKNDSAERPAHGIWLELTGEAGAVLSREKTGEHGDANFVVRSAELGSPGIGELRVSFAGDAETNPSSKAMRIVRRTRVRLDASKASNGGSVLAEADPQDGVTMSVVADACCAARGCMGAATSVTGTVVATVGDSQIGAAPLMNGAARLRVSFPSTAPGEVAVRFHFLPSAPWFEPGDEFLTTLALRPPSAWGKVATGATAVALLGWFLASRASEGFRSSPVRVRRKGGSAETLGIRIVRVAIPGNRDSNRWTGLVIDAHDGTPIAGVSIRAERPGFDRVVVLLQTLSESDGSFALGPGETLPGDQLTFESAYHGSLRRKLPTWGHIEVALAQRRRRLVDGLVEWARAAGVGRALDPDPTPGDVLRGSQAESRAAAWAAAVEHAAYSGSTVDAATESHVDSLLPRDPGSSGRR